MKSHRAHYQYSLQHRDHLRSLNISRLPLCLTETMYLVLYKLKSVRQVFLMGLLEWSQLCRGAITSLQATVNNLLQKETQSTHQNSLETFYNSDTRNSTAAVPNIFQHGIHADDLPHIDVVSESLKNQLCLGNMSIWLLC